MPGVELESTEFAYLLLTVRADHVIGLEAPGLFPEKAKEQDKVYRKGWERLQANGWVKPLPDDAYDLDPFLLEMVAVVAAPGFVVATTSNAGTPGDRQLLLHYLNGDRTVELAAMEDDRYALGFISDVEELSERSAQLMALEASAQQAEFTLPEPTFEKIRTASAEGAAKKIAPLLKGVDLEPDLRESLEAALAGESRGQVLLLQAVDGEVEHGRRAHIYGQKDSAWIAFTESADAEQVIIRNCDPETLGAWIGSGLEELMG